MKDSDLILMIIFALLIWKFLGVWAALIGGVIYYLFKK